MLCAMNVGSLSAFGLLTQSIKVKVTHHMCVTCVESGSQPSLPLIITLRLNIQRECPVIIVETIIAQDLLARPTLKGLMKYPNNFCAPNVITKQCPKVVLKGTLTEYTQRNSTSLVSLVGKFSKT